MPVPTVGNTAIPYEIRRSPRAKRMRIRVRPGGIDVVAPRFTLKRDVAPWQGTTSLADSVWLGD